MMIFYTCDNEGPAVMDLEDLIGNFTVSEAWESPRFTEDGMRYELDNRGCYTGYHENGGFLVLNLELFKDFLTPMPDHLDRYHVERAKT